MALALLSVGLRRAAVDSTANSEAQENEANTNEKIDKNYVFVRLLSEWIDIIIFSRG